jgi:arsenite transporter
MASTLGFLDRYLTVWILLAMAAGIALGALFPAVASGIEGMSDGSTNWALATGLIVMMIPPLARVQYGRLGLTFRDLRVLILSLVQNWLMGPILMFALAIVFVPDRPELMQGLVLIGLARCIAMVIVWNDLACGDADYAAGLVAFNSVFQVLMYSLYAWVFLDLVPSAIGLQAVTISVPITDIASSVGIYLGIPLAVGAVLSMSVRSWRGNEWYSTVLMPRLAPITLIALLATIILMFAAKGRDIVAVPLDVVRVALPLIVYFLVMFFGSRWMSARAGVNAQRSTTLAFTAASNNFELAIAVAIAAFGISSGQAFAAIVGPLVEVPVMLLLVRFARKS